MSVKNIGIELIAVQTEVSETGKVETNSFITWISGKIKSGYAFIWMDDAVRMGTLENGNLILADGTIPALQSIQKARFFNKKSEVLVWKSGQSWNYRIRNDEVGKLQNVTEADQILWGNKLHGDVWTDDRGMTFKLPEPLKISKNNHSRLAINTRHYIGETAIGQATYNDVRFVDLVWKD
ncbi:MAG: TIGR03984 family CRISPR-associated protein [Bacteroidetes bacterium]|nr:TIGR03984 family CRISPR-associated protein [Bacteroidota bacterium]